jgi:DNA mismatch repair protein MutS
VGRGGPRDLGVVRAGLLAAGLINLRLKQGLGLPDLLAAISADLEALDEQLLDDLARALIDELPILAREGGFVRKNYRPELDELRLLRDESRQIMARMQSRYSEQTGVKNLKIRHNNVLGYFVEVTASHGDRLMNAPLSETFVHRQTMANAVRFTTLELGEVEQKITAKLKEADQRITASKQAAMQEVTTIATSTTGQIIDHLIGTRVSPGDLDKTIKSLSKA